MHKGTRHRQGPEALTQKKRENVDALKTLQKTSKGIETEDFKWGPLRDEIKVLS